MILGLDFDTRAVHAVLLDDDTNQARYVPVPFVDHKPPFQLDDARNVRPALRKAIWAASQQPLLFGTDGWESIWLGGPTGFQYGWAHNAVRYVLAAEPVGNPALITIG